MSQDDYNPRNNEKTEDDHTPLPPAGDEQAAKFLHALDYDVGNPSGLEIRLIGGQGKPRIERTFDWRGICRANQAGDNVYFGVAYRDGNGGKAENVTHATAVWADIDGKDWDTVNPDAGKEAALDHLTNFLSAELEPSIIVDSGHGYHVYWLLSEPYKFTSDKERRRFKRVLDGISSVVRGDRSSNDIARILRLPGTRNTKYKEWRDCSIIHWKPQRVHDFAEVEKSLPKQAVGDKPNRRIHRATDFNRDLNIAIKSLPLLKPERVNNYEQWLEVGMALHSISNVLDERDVAFAVWENWSRGSKKYEPGKCIEKWNTFSTNGRSQLLTVDSLRNWAGEDSGHRVVIPGGRNPKPSAYRQALNDLGYSFSRNEMNQAVHVNGIEITDAIRADILVDLNENRYRNNGLAELTWESEANKNKFHPIREYLDSLTWDGEDYIGKLATFFVDIHGVFPLYLKKFLVGAVGRVYRNGRFNAALVLDGPQGIGKSYLSRWLVGDLIRFHVEKSVDPANKDDVIRKLSVWIWEVGEFGATIRKADVEGLKHFISQEQIRERKPYAHYDTQGPAISSFICTVNDDGNGFLNDPTGSRRFNVCELTAIDWSYARAVDRNQLWAQAKALFDTGEEWQLSTEEAQEAARINQEYQMQDMGQLFLDEIIKFAEGVKTPTVDILNGMREVGAKGSDQMLGRQIAQYIMARYHTKPKNMRFKDGDKEYTAKGYLNIHIIPEENRRLGTLISTSSGLDLGWHTVEHNYE